MYSQGINLIVFVIAKVIMAEDDSFDLTSLIRDVSGDIYGLPDEHTSPQGFPGASTLGAQVDCQSAAKLKAAKISQHQLWPTVFGLKSQKRLSSYAQTEGYLKDIGKAILSLFHERKTTSETGWTRSYNKWENFATLLPGESAQWLHASLHCTANEYLKKLTEMEGFKEFQTSDFEITVSKVELHADPIGCYVPPISRVSSDVSVILGIEVGETYVPSNMVYFMDPRPSAGPLELQGWTQGNVPFEWELKRGNALLFPSYLRYHMVANRNQQERMYVMADITLTYKSTDVGQLWHPDQSFMTANSTFTKDHCQQYTSELTLISQWTTPVVVMDLPLDDKFHSQIEKLILKREQEHSSVHKSNKGGWQSPGDLFKLDTPEISTLANWTYACTFEYLKRSRSAWLCEEWGTPADHFLRVSVNVAWASVNRKFDSNSPHIHPHSIVSGAFYVSLGGDKDTSLYFTDPRHSLMCGHSFYHNVHPREMKFKAKHGRMILFPGWLEHYVKPHSVDSPRISISFNTLAESVGRDRLPHGDASLSTKQCFVFE
jgi:uncharacterized protein (TIGR02466 family)